MCVCDSFSDLFRLLPYSAIILIVLKIIKYTLYFNLGDRITILQLCFGTVVKCPNEH